MYKFHLSFMEKVIKTSDLQFVQLALEAKRNDLQEEGKTNEQLDKMIDVVDESVLYIHELYQHAEKQTSLASKQEIELKQALKEIESLKHQIEF